MRARDKKYPLNQCALYRCGSRKRLFKLLLTSESKYEDLRSENNLYRTSYKTKKNGSIRTIHAPRGDLKRLQRRISELLMRVIPADYLMSPVRGRSNIDNAAKHRNSQSYRQLDIADFYPNCSANKVAEFFSDALQCPPDVVAILVWLTTRNATLPQGSPSSPILAYWSYREMWAEIESAANQGQCKVTIYVDDITLSGKIVRENTVQEIKQIIFKHGHRTKDDKEEARFMTPATVTGVVLREGALLLPNSQHHVRHILRKKLERVSEGDDFRRLEASIAGHDETERQISIRNLKSS